MNKKLILSGVGTLTIAAVIATTATTVSHANNNESQNLRLNAEKPTITGDRGSDSEKLRNIVQHFEADYKGKEKIKLAEVDDARNLKHSELSFKSVDIDDVNIEVMEAFVPNPGSLGLFIVLTDKKTQEKSERFSVLITGFLEA